MLGREVATLVNEEKKPAIMKLNSMAQIFHRDLFYSLVAGEFSAAGKMMLIK
jgi:hypothetical protein